MDIQPVKTDADCRRALKEIEALMTAAPESPEGEKLDVLVALVEAYEHTHYPMEMPDPVKVTKLELE